MKRKIMNYGIMALVTMSFLTSCGGKSDAPIGPDKPKKGDYPIAVDTAMSGDFSQYYKVTKAVLKIEDYGSKLMVEVKRTDVAFEEMDLTSLKFEHEGSGGKYQYDIKADLLGANDLPTENSLGHHANDPFVTMRSLKAGETVWLEFSARDADPTKSKKVKLSSTLAVNLNYGVSSSSDGSDSDSGDGNTGDASDAGDADDADDSDDLEDAASKLLLKTGKKAIDLMDKSGYLDREIEKAKKKL
jgi:hypothetical protein